MVDLELRRAAERRKTQKFTLATSFFAKSSSREDRGESTTKTTSSDDDDIDAFEARRVVSSEKKRDALLYVAFYLLLNVAEDVAVERKMKKRDVVSYLMECVGTRGDVDLLVLCVTFLRKLSVRRENVEEMLRGDELDGERKSEVGTSGETSSVTSLSENENEPFRDDVVARVARFLADGVPDVLVSATLRLLLNVSFHERARDAMHERALLPRLCVLARNATHANVALALLYHASVDERRRRFFAVARPVSGTDLALDALLRVSETDSVAHSAPTVAGLAVNLSADARCAEALAGYENGKPFLAFLAGRLRRKDALGLKIARNVFRRRGRAGLPFGGSSRESRDSRRAIGPIVDRRFFVGRPAWNGRRDRNARFVDGRAPPGDGRRARRERRVRKRGRVRARRRVLNPTRNRGRRRARGGAVLLGVRE